MDTKSQEKFLEQIQNDLKNISLESKRLKSMQGLREATEEAIVKVRSFGQQQHQQSQSLFQLANQVLYPLVQGCESRDAKVVRLSLSLIQRLIVHKAVDFKAARNIADTLWMLMEASVEEVKILQTITLLLTTSHAAQHETLAKCLVICFRLNFTKDPTTNSIAGATIRQLVPAVFERISVSKEERTLGHEEFTPNFAQLVGAQPLLAGNKDEDPLVVDAFLMFQDIVLLVSAEQPRWMSGIIEMTRSFGLELLESVLRKFPALFAGNEAFRLLLKERVCSLVIRLFSPNIKYRPATNHQQQQQSASQQEKPYYPITSKLLRVVSILVLEYHKVLTTETEIFLSLILKFLDPDKPLWQNCMALEVLHKIAVDPELLVFVCSTFDQNKLSTKVFQDTINALGAYVQNVMLSPNGDAATAAGAEAQQTQQQEVQNLQQQPGFHYRNVWKPLTISFIGGQTKELFLDISERGEVPSVSDGYGISLAYAVILDTVRSMSLIVNQKLTKGEDTLKQLIDSSWCGILAALSLLLDACTDDSSTENVLKALETYASLCGQLGVEKPRDAFLASLCKASLPPHYTLNVLKATPCTQTVSGPKKGSGAIGELGAYEATLHTGDADIRHQVVAVGTPLPTSSLPASAHQGPVMLTAKNLQCMRSILSVAHCHGNLLGQSWHIILTTLQHLVWILGLKPANSGVSSLPSMGGGGSGGGSSHGAGSESSSNSVITTAVMADLPVLSNMVTRLFESSSSLSETSVAQLIDALCKLSEESMELATTNREPSLFAVAKLLETALANLSRVDSVWRPITAHLLIVCAHPHLRMRQWGCEALTFLVRQSLQHRFAPPLGQNSRVQLLLLSPLGELCATPYPDVRQKQLDTVLHVLHSSGESLNQGWPLVLTMVGSIERNHSDVLIRAAFQCLQLVFTDFLPVIPYRCYPQCVECAAKFGSQETELNVSLTSVGLLWNLSDYFFQNVKTLQRHQEGEQGQQIFPDFPGCKNIPSFDKLWMCLYYKLKDLCLDPRPAVRKSSGQTLFSTIAAHGSVLESNTWQAVLWQVLFPLLDNVIIQSDNASPEIRTDIMIHHSRNTAQKQWAETKVLTISGVVRVFNTKRKLLKTMDDYSKAWLLLLEYVEKMALSDTTEVSLAALKAMQEMIMSSSSDDHTSSPKASFTSTTLKDINWNLCWKAWLNIGTQKTKFVANADTATPSQANLLLTGYVKIFSSLFPRIRTQFRRADMESLGEVLLLCIQVPIEHDSGASAESLTPVHVAAMDCLQLAEEVALEGGNPTLAPAIFEFLFQVISLAFSPKQQQSHGHDQQQQRQQLTSGRFREKLSLLGEVAAERLGDFFLAAYPLLQQGPKRVHILATTVKVFRSPLRLKYRCFRDSNWRTSVNVLLKVLRTGIPLARSLEEEVKVTAEPFWEELAQVLEHFLFSESALEQRQEERMADEAVDCHIIELLREEVLPFPNAVAPSFIRKVVILLNRGSIHSSIQLSEDCSGSVGLREDFAKLCFETLLDFSLVRDEPCFEMEQSECSLTNRLAITSLLQRFQEVLVDAIDGEKLNRNIPLRRQKTSEIAFVLRAIATVVASMKKASNPQVDDQTWRQAIALYPYLVQCTETNSPQISASVKEALLQYHDLLKPYGYPLP